MPSRHFLIFGAAFAALSLAFHPSARADLVLITSQQRVTSSGFADYQLWDSTVSPTYFEHQDGAWTDSQSWGDATLPFSASAGGHEDYPYARASGSASQSSSSGLQELSVSGLVSGGWQDSSGGPGHLQTVANGHSEGHSIYDIVFQLTAPATVSLTGNVLMDFSGPPIAVSFVKFTGAGGTLLDTSDAYPLGDVGGGAFAFSGLLGPGVYTLDAEALLNTKLGSTDFSAQGRASFGLTLDTDTLVLPDPPPVPEPSTWVLVGLGLIGAGAWGKRGARGRIG